MDPLTPIGRMKEAILKKYPRLTENDSFQFSCGKNVPCFTQCCADVNIVLTPYDIVRMKKRLGMSSEDFLERHCIIPFAKEQRLPVILLKMKDDEKKPCPFVGDEGCTIYEDRPWACRMYPLGVASPKEGASEEELFYFLMKEDSCEGFGQEGTWTVRSWMEDQGVALYDELGEEFKEITLHDHFRRGGSLDPAKMEQFFMVCYNLDKFRRFVFESSFLKKVDVDEETLRKVKEDDAALMRLGFQWLRFCLFGEKTLKIRENVKEATLKMMGPIERERRK